MKERLSAYVAAMEWLGIPFELTDEKNGPDTAEFGLPACYGFTSRETGYLFDLDAPDHCNDQPKFLVYLLDAIESHGKTWMPVVFHCHEESTEGHGFDGDRYLGRHWVCHRRAFRNLHPGFVCQIFSMGKDSRVAYDGYGETRCMAVLEAARYLWLATSPPGHPARVSEAKGEASTQIVERQGQDDA